MVPTVPPVDSGACDIRGRTCYAAATDVFELPTSFGQYLESACVMRTPRYACAREVISRYVRLGFGCDREMGTRISEFVRG